MKAKHIFREFGKLQMQSLAIKETLKLRYHIHLPNILGLHSEKVAMFNRQSPSHIASKFDKE